MIREGILFVSEAHSLSFNITMVSSRRAVRPSNPSPEAAVSLTRSVPSVKAKLDGVSATRQRQMLDENQQSDVLGMFGPLAHRSGKRDVEG